MPKETQSVGERNFAEQMEALVAEAHRQESSRDKSPVSLQELLRPVVMGVVALGKAAAENSKKLERVQAFLEAQSSLPAQISSLQGELNRDGMVNEKLFDALHEELRGYKDNFLLEILQKPIISDLIMLYDDLSDMHRRLELFMQESGQGESGEKNSSPENEFLKNLGMSLNNTTSLLIEVLTRLDVHRGEPSTGMLDKLKHRAVAVSEAGTADEDGEIIQSIKPSFIWRQRIIRPEEVIIKRWSGNARL